MKFVLDLTWLSAFFDSASFTGFATILTAIAAYLIFLQQRRDEKTKAARIILVEISDCEDLLDAIRTNGIDFSNIRQLAISNSWFKYKHLFANDLDARQLKLIDNFYKECELINNELKEAYSLPEQWKEKARIILEKQADISLKSKTRAQYDSAKKALTFFEQDTYWFQPNQPINKILNRIGRIQYITSTPAGEKLKKLARI